MTNHSCLMPPTLPKVRGIAYRGHLWKPGQVLTVGFFDSIPFSLRNKIMVIRSGETLNIVGGPFKDSRLVYWRVAKGLEYVGWVAQKSASGQRLLEIRG